ncbi:MAG: CotH kinase family protein, partial [Planctomycetota bacterium]
MALSSTPLITEFMASNDATLTDGLGDFSDWIEIHNPTDASVDLAGWRLTDDAEDLSKWQFPDLPQAELDPGEYLVLFASGQDDEDFVDPQGFLHTTFRLSAGGEYLALSDAAENLVQAYSPTFPPQSADVSFGIEAVDSPTGYVFLATPTPGAPNSTASVVEEVGFSHASQVFAGSLDIELSGASHPGQAIHYTLDGSLPDAGSPIYSEPISVSSTVQIRARIVEPGKGDGPVATGSYSRLGADVLAFESQLPILLIENFGGGDVPGKGWNQTGAGIQQVPRQSSAVTVFSNSDGSASFLGETDLHSRSGIRERGAYSTTFPQPQYSLEVWGEEDDDRDVSVFGMAEESDWILYAPNPDIDQTLMNNQIMFGLAYPTTVWAPQVRYVEAFLNTDGGDVTMADYVGLYVWTERVKRDPGRLDFEPFAADGSSGGWLLSINRMDAVPEDDPTASPRYFHTPGPDGVLRTSPNSPGVGDDIPRQYNAFINFEHPNGYDLNAAQRNSIESWFAEMEDVLYGRTATAWNDPVDGYAKYIDVDNFVDYFILHNLSKNSDGLLLSMWIYNPDPNNGGKLKFGPPWDHDLGSFEGSPSSNLLHRTDRLWYTRLFEDPAFIRRYQDRWQMWRQSILSDAGMSQVIDQFVDEIGQEAALRDGVANLSSRVDSVRSWLSARAAAIDAQFLQPPAINMPGGEVEAGFEALISAPLGRIYYTTDGTDPLLPSGRINPNAFLHDGGAEATTLISRGSEWKYLDDGSNQRRAWRAADFNDSEWESGQAPLGYGDGDESPTGIVGFVDVNPAAPGIQKNITTYFRATFDVEDPQAFASVALRILRDDGASIHINGVEVARSNLPGQVGDDAINYTTAAVDAVGGSDESTFFYTYSIEPSVLVAGRNTVAVEIHQANSASSDISFDLELIGSVATGTPITLNESTTLTARAHDRSRWSAPLQADFFVGAQKANASNLRIAELNYHPFQAQPALGEAGVDQDLFEFIELVNIDDAGTIDLKGASFTDGVSFEFENFTPLAPGERVLVVRDQAAFESRYGLGLPIAGEFQGEASLS